MTGFDILQDVESIEVGRSWQRILEDQVKNWFFDQTENREKVDLWSKTCNRAFES